MPKQSRLFVLIAALVTYLVFIWRTSFVVFGTRTFVLFEDAMISMRYARNLAAGNGLVWNAGEEPIEGYTNLLWTLWMSAAHALGFGESKVSLFIMLTGVAILFANAWAIERIARKVSDSPWVPLFVFTAVLFDYPLVFWTLRGMEVGALTLVVDLIVLLAFENEDKFSVNRLVLVSFIMSAGLLLRSDSVVPIGLVALYVFLTSERRFTFAAIAAVSLGSTLALQTAVRYRYYHEFVPNTYYLKLLHIPLSARIKRGAFVSLQVLTQHLAIPLSLTLTALSFVLKSKLAEGVVTFVKSLQSDVVARRRVLLAVMFSAQVGYATYVGGDAWEWMLYANRYMCVGMPAFIVLTALSVEWIMGLSAEERVVAVKRAFSFVALCGLVLLALNGFAKVRPEQGIARTIVMSKLGVLVGGALVVLGGIGLGVGAKVAGRVAEMKDRLAAGAVGAAILAAAVLWVPCHLQAGSSWALRNAAQYRDEARYARLGMLIDKATPENLRVAVVAAGATPYFSHRPSEDLLGKNDKVIAKKEPAGVFSPGHDKWDYKYSLGERGPDLIVELGDVTEEDEAYVASLGFETLPNGLRLKKTAKGVNRRALSMPFDTNEEAEAAITAATGAVALGESK